LLRNMDGDDCGVNGLGMIPHPGKEKRRRGCDGAKQGSGLR
jgi:hypothetical protein